MLLTCPGVYSLTHPRSIEGASRDMILQRILVPTWQTACALGLGAQLCLQRMQELDLACNKCFAVCKYWCFDERCKHFKTILTVCIQRNGDGCLVRLQLNDRMLQSRSARASSMPKHPVRGMLIVAKTYLSCAPSSRCCQTEGRACQDQAD